MMGWYSRGTLYAYVVHRIVLNVFWLAAHDCYSMEVDLEHCYNIPRYHKVIVVPG